MDNLKRDSQTSLANDVTVECYNHFVNNKQMANFTDMTAPILEYLTDKPNMKETDTQTDLLLNKPSVGRKQAQRSLVLVTNELGERVWIDDEENKHVTTQIVAADNLYDFNREVEPILSVLITKTLEQARMEVLEEEEMKIMKDQRKVFEQRKMAELAEVQREEANEKRLEQETTRRKIQSQLIEDRQVGVHKQLCSRMVSKSFLRTLMKNSLDSVEQIGFFDEDSLTQLHSSFLPWLYDEVCYKLDKYNDYMYTISRMSDTVEDYHAESHSQSLNNNIRRHENMRLAHDNKIEQRKQKRQRKIEERAKQAEQDRVNNLRTYLQSTLGRPETVRDKVMTISDCNGISDTKNRTLACLPGGLLLELYGAVECLKRISEVEEFKNLVPALNAKLVRSLIKNMQDFRVSKECDWKYELGFKLDIPLYLTQVQETIDQNERKEEWELIEKLKSASNPFEVFYGLKSSGNEQLFLDFAAELCSSLTFYFKELYYSERPGEQRPKIKLPQASAAAEEEGIAGQAAKPEEKKADQRDSKGTIQAENEADFANSSINTNFRLFQPTVMNTVHEGIMRYLIQEEREKGTLLLTQP